MQLALSHWTDFAEDVKALNRKDYIIRKPVKAVIFCWNGEQAFLKADAHLLLQENNGRDILGCTRRTNFTEVLPNTNHGGRVASDAHFCKHSYLEHLQPFLEAGGRLHGCDAAPLLPLAVGCPQVPKCRRRGGTWHQPRGTATQTKSDSHR